MPLKLISNFVSSLLRRNEPYDNTKDSASNSQKSSSLTSVTFSPTITIQGLWTKKDDMSDTTTSSLENEKWLAHQEQLIYWQNQPPIFDPFPTFCIQDYKLIETLG
jgi:protein kinase X